ncbi:TIGR02186 family protein [Ancylobacter amanitiformis]|uniref:Uncharacterized protein (TIGR02186 family) n=1 Tax=Ancylobacter amanitiformis TaxID=217069 RepID=A0ABU0LVZ5_9HYPH|nr:TIGR02186 family protein [Ancylobacter amanitiformis]MDQ0512775.1 uncharacterized protein (TIGR02186 family) [Ancylobacter amanitiformis]
MSAARRARARWDALRLLLLAAALAAFPGVARADGLVLSLSKARVTITSSFAGENIVLFGVIEPGAGAAATGASPGASPAPDVVVTVRGPNQSFLARRKERRLGLWINVDSRSFLAAPSYLAVLSNRDPALMSDADTLRQEQAGFANNRLLQRIGSDYADVVAQDPFRQAFLRVKQAQGLYVEDHTGVEFIAPHIFRAVFPIPGRAPIGTYDVVVKVFADRTLTQQAALRLDVAKVDFEQAVAGAAQDHPWLYGFICAFGAIAVGFCANIVFRRD